MLRPVSEDIEDLYELCSDDGYTEEYGLRLDIEMGMGDIYVVRIKSSRKLILLDIVVHYCKCQYFNHRLLYSAPDR